MRKPKTPDLCDRDTAKRVPQKKRADQEPGERSEPFVITVFTHRVRPFSRRGAPTDMFLGHVKYCSVDSSCLAKIQINRIGMSAVIPLRCIFAGP